MGWLDGLKGLVNSVDTEYDRRIRAASNVKEYSVGGHSDHAAHDGHTSHAKQHAHGDTIDQRLEGEGGALGHLQANAGPHLEDSGQETADRE